MLEIGNGMTLDQDRGHFTMYAFIPTAASVPGPARYPIPYMLPEIWIETVRSRRWCILASPLIAGNDLRKMSADTVKILTNPHAIKINQDTLGKQATLVTNSSSATQVWVKPLADPPKSWAVALLNRESAEANIKLSFAAVPAMQATYEVFDLWDNAKSLGVKKGSVAATVPGTTAAFYKLAPSS